MSPGSSRFPNSRASPTLGVSSPVSIFIVVVLPLPFEPRKPNLPALDGEVDAVDRGEVAEAAGEIAGDDDRLCVDDAAWRNLQRFVIAPLCVGKQRDERILERGRAGFRP